MQIMRNKIQSCSVETVNSDVPVVQVTEGYAGNAFAGGIIMEPGVEL